MNNQHTFVAFHGDETLKLGVVLETEKIIHKGEIVREDDVEKSEMDVDAALRSDYIEIANETGVPVWFVMLTSTLAAYMTEAEAARFMMAVVRGIPVGADVSKIWSPFARNLMRAGNGGLAAYLKGEKQTSVLIHLSTLHKMTAPDLESFARKARELEDLSNISDPSPAYALAAASHIGWASHFGGYGGTVAETRAARFAVSAVHTAVQAMLFADEAKFDQPSAYAFIGQLLVDALESTFSQSQN